MSPAIMPTLMRSAVMPSANWVKASDRRMPSSWSRASSAGVTGSGTEGTSENQSGEYGRQTAVGIRMQP